ncbi:MAG: YbfB/YjiJ family MFS transporter [Rhodospirillales bacterium]
MRPLPLPDEPASARPIPARPTPLQQALAALVGLALAVGFGRFAYTPLLAMMEAEGRIGAGAGGYLASAHLAGYLVGALWLAIRPSAPSLAPVFGALAVVTAGMGGFDQVLVWAGLRFLAGVLSALGFIGVTRRALSGFVHLPVDRRNRLQALAFAGVGLGIVASGALVSSLEALTVGSRAAWIFLAVVLLLLGPMTARFLGPIAEPKSKGSAASRRPGAVRWPLVLAYGAMGFGYIVPATYLPLMARLQLGVAATPVWVWPLFGLAATVSVLVLVPLARRASDRRIWIFGQLLMASGLVLPALLPGEGPLALAALAWAGLAWAGLAWAGLAVGGTFMVITLTGLREAHRLAGPDEPTRALAVLTAAFALGQAVAPALAGAAHDATGGFAAPLGIAALVLLAGLACLGFASETIKEKG